MIDSATGALLLAVALIGSGVLLLGAAVRDAGAARSPSSDATDPRP